MDSETKKIQEDILKLESEIKGIERLASGEIKMKVDTTNQITLKELYNENNGKDDNLEKDHVKSKVKW